MNNVEGYQESALLVIGGLVSEVDPPSLPAGSSPVCCDMDFTVSSARTRDGIASVYPNSTTTSAIILLDANLVLWEVTCDTSGILHTTVVTGKVPQTVFLNDTILSASWQLVITTGGLPEVEAVPAQSFYPLSIGLIASSTVTYALQVASGQLTTTLVTMPTPGASDFNWIQGFEEYNGTQYTLALDNSGNLWQEDVTNNPGVLSIIYSDIEPDTFAVGASIDDREFIALSDLAQGTDMPRQYNGQWVDRISQVGPAAPPTVTFTSTSYTVLTITQPSAFDGATDLAAVLWSAGPTLRQAGSTLTFYFNNGNMDINSLYVGANVVLQSFTGALSGINSTGSPLSAYTVTSVGTAIGAGGLTYPIFTVVAPSVNYVDSVNTGIFGSISLTLSTLTTSAPVPNLQVGSQMTISGASPSTWNSTWTVLYTPNASQLNITATSLSGNVASYSYIIITGTAPTVGQQVTVTGTVNGDGIFNIVNSVITSVSANSFSVGIVSPNIASASEDGNGIVNGTIFQFDPAELINNDSVGGTLVIAGGLGAGTRGCVYMFLTRNGYLTQPSPEVVFTLTDSANQLIVGQLAPGPPNVIARVVAFTGANGATQSGGGGFYFWIEQPVTVIDNGQNVTYTATIVNDNVSTEATFTFTDAILLAATGISIQGNNNFDQVELGSCLGVIPYSERLFVWGEQNKIPNLLNYSFDGGVGQILPPSGSTTPAIVTYPLGWTIDPTNGTGGTLTTSPLFGDAYYIKNSTGSTQTLYGMITQSAYHDSFGVPIIFTATTYSIRVTADSPSGAGSGDLVVDLYSPSTTQIWGSYTLPLASLTTTMSINTGTLLTTPFSVVPSDLLIRIYAKNIPNGGDVLIDRIEPFPTEVPVLTTQMKGSYIDNFEAFDINTGVLGATQNQQPIRNSFTLFDNLYIVKTKSFYSTSDNGVTEPDFWNVREVSNKVGTPSIHGVDVGEGWALIVSQAGLYLFAGGDPVKISPELDGNPNGAPGLWESISWAYGDTIWIRNDTAKRRILIGVPLPTPNQWMPHFPTNLTPTQPNVILMCNYKELMTSEALESQGPVRLTYTGDLRTLALGRKWSSWSIQAAYADFITRPDTTTPVFFCGDTGTGKIYQQIPGNRTDDGAMIPYDYFTYGFPKSQEAEQKQMGFHELEAVYMSLTINGGGNLYSTIYPDNITSQDAIALYPEPLKNIGGPDKELPVNQVGNRFFIEFYAQQMGDWMDLSRVVLALTQNPWAPVRGTNE